MLKKYALLNYTLTTGFDGRLYKFNRGFVLLVWKNSHAYHDVFCFLDIADT